MNNLCPRLPLTKASFCRILKETPKGDAAVEIKTDRYRLSWACLQGEAAHETGRKLLAALYGGPLPEICTTPRGKPYFAAGGQHFSISHTEDHVFCCISRHNIGIDAEEANREISPAVAHRYLSTAEYARWEASPNPREALLRLWILKEAYAKLNGRGLGNYLRETDFSPDDPRITNIDGCLVAVLTE